MKISNKKRWLFRLTSLTIIPLLILIALEMSLRFVGYGYNTNAIISTTINDQKFYRDNSKYGWRFFPKEMARHFDGFVFPAEKSTNTYRVFVLGASAARGIPDPAYGFGRTLKTLLQARYPDANIEVITVAMVAINSHVVYQIAKECARYEPDMFVVYLGNNEVIGPYGVGTVFAPISPSLSAIRTGLAIKSTRIGQLLEGVASALSPKKSTPKAWGGMTMFLDKQVRFDFKDIEYVYSYYENNLHDICRLGLDAGAKVILCNVASNLKDNPPFASLHKENLTLKERKKWDRLYQFGIEQETNGNYRKAIQYYLEADKIDETFADLQFRLGRCYFELSKYDESKKAYIKARELDTLRFRADNRINKIIHNVSQSKSKEGVYFVDCLKAFESNSPYGITGYELFYEHVHLKFKGNYILAKLILDNIENTSPKSLNSNKQPVLTEEQCAKRLAFTGWDKHRLEKKMLDNYIKKPPFTNQLYHEKMVAFLERNIKEFEVYNEMESIEKDSIDYQRALEQNPKDWRLLLKYANFILEAVKDKQAALEMYKKVNDILSNDIAYLEIGLILNSFEKLDEAKKAFFKVLEMRPYHPSAYYSLGDIYRKKGEIKKSIKCFQKCIELEPKVSSEPYRELAGIYFDLAKKASEKKKYKEVVECLENALEYNPGSITAYEGLADAYQSLNKFDNAFEQYLKILEIQPDNVKVYFHMASLLYDQSRFAEADKYLTKELTANPSYVEMILTLADKLLGKQQTRQAHEYYLRAIKLKPDSEDLLNTLGWLEAASAIEGVRNPKQAIKYARRACELSGNKKPEFLDTLALAYAAQGEFKKSIKTAQKAIKIANSEKNAELAERIQARLELYRAGKTYLDPDLKN